MAPPLLSLKRVSLSFGGTPLLDDVNFSVAPRDRIALVGRNGSGKSTLLKIAAGMVEFDGGEYFSQPGATIKYLSQEPDLSGFSTVLDFVQAGIGPGDDPYRAPYLLEQLGLKGDENPASLSGGETRRAALARILAPNPDVLLLDEPTNHLDLPAIEWLEAELKSLKSALVIISHDRAFLGALTRKTLWLDRGQTRQLEQGFGEFEVWRDKVLEEELVADHKLGRKIVAEEHWLRYGVTARRKRNVRRLDQLHQLRKTRAEHVHVKPDINISVNKGRQTGTLIIEAKNISKSFGETPLVNDFSLKVIRGDRVAIVGANGTGKTTLVKLLIGELAPDEGEIKQGSSVQMALLDQTRDSLDPNTSLKDALTGGGRDTVLINGVEKHVIGYMKDFLFAPEQLNTPLRSLSGGERARVMLARALALPSNLLVLDEPTNDLDLETLDLLQETISNYPGTIILVSHDRDFIDRIATITLISEGSGLWTSYAGGYSDMVALRGQGVRAKIRVHKSDFSIKTKSKSNSQNLDQTGKNPKKSKKLSFNQLHALKTLPQNLKKLQSEIDDMQKQLADPKFYSKDPENFAAISKSLTLKQSQFEEMENQWLELEILQEQLASD
ncbi:MAG: ABC-F family ATP-binding cassette domain-containing protein [Devosiaceae bacterium]|nr:ABC-F family ATP-binding cassette domain-containing protein [Devosiaceae bacterium]